MLKYVTRFLSLTTVVLAISWFATAVFETFIVSVLIASNGTVSLIGVTAFMYQPLLLAGAIIAALIYYVIVMINGTGE